MLLALDIGNTNISAGVFEGETLIADFRLQSDQQRTADEFAIQLNALLQLRANVTLREINAVAIASVVPSLTRLLVQALEAYTKQVPFIVRSGETETGLTIAYEPAESLGADRLVNAFAAHSLYGRSADGVPAACLVVDYGTATKIEAITAEGIYRGGAILPGVGISLDALFSRAALLRRVDLSGSPAAVIGTNTNNALRSGVLYGFAAQTDGLVQRFRDEMGILARVIATGGYASLIAPHTATVEIIDAHLTLHGLRLLYAQQTNPRHE